MVDFAGLRDEALKAYDFVPTDPSRAFQIPWFADAVVYFVKYSPTVKAPTPNRFLPSTTRQAIDELNAVKNAARDLYEALSELHSPSMEALGAMSFKKLDGVRAAPVTYFTMYSELLAYTSQLKNAAIKSQPVGNKSANKPANVYALSFAKLLAQQYRELTLTPLNIPEDLPKDYKRFVNTMFDVVGMAGTPTFFAKQAILHP